VDQAAAVDHRGRPHAAVAAGLAVYGTMPAKI
jgi:hypothetical protein